MLYRINMNMHSKHFLFTRIFTVVLAVLLVAFQIHDCCLNRKIMVGASDQKVSVNTHCPLCFPSGPKGAPTWQDGLADQCAPMPSSKGMNKRCIQSIKPVYVGSFTTIQSAAGFAFAASDYLSANPRENFVALSVIPIEQASATPSTTPLYLIQLRLLI